MNRLAIFENYFSLQYMFRESEEKLRGIFKETWSEKFSTKWTDTDENCINILKKETETESKSLTRFQLFKLSLGDSQNWDFVLLVTILSFKALRSKKYYKWIVYLHEIYNTVSYTSDMIVYDDVFNKIWKEYSLTMKELGSTDEDLESLNLKFSSNSEKSTNESLKKDLDKILESALEKLENKDYTRAIEIYSQALKEPYSESDLFELYYNRSQAYFDLVKESESDDDSKNIYLSLIDAQKSSSLDPKSGKAYAQLGKIYLIINELENSNLYYEKSLNIDSKDEEVKMILSTVKTEIDRLDQPRTNNDLVESSEEKSEILSRKDSDKYGIALNPKITTKLKEILKQKDPTMCDVYTAHEYRDGLNNVKKNYTLAAKYYGKAAQKGNAEALYNLALLYKKGLGVKIDYKIAIDLFKLAASQPINKDLNGVKFPNVGVAESEHSLGLAYQNGIYVRKSLKQAIHWYKLAVKHNNCNSANNLALLYMQKDSGLRQDLDYAERLLLLAVKLGSHESIDNLVDLYLLLNDPRRALMWHERSLKRGSIFAIERNDQIRSKIKLLKDQINKKLKYESSERIQDFSTGLARLPSSKSFQIQKPAYYLEEPYAFDLELLKRFAQDGSVTSAKMLKAIELFFAAISMLESDDKFDEIDFVRKLCDAYLIEPLVCILNISHLDKVIKIIENCLKPEPCDQDLKSRICYVYLKPSAEFLDESLQKYPNNLTMLSLRGCMYCFSQQWDEALADFNKILSKCPDDYETLYHKSVVLRINGNMNQEAINCYKLFLSKAPADHRKVPESFYSLANLVYADDPGFVDAESLRKCNEFYYKGLESEKHQLPCFLPYKSRSKEKCLMFLAVCNTQVETKTSHRNRHRKNLLNKDQRLVDLIVSHREIHHKNLLSMRQTPVERKKEESKQETNPDKKYVSSLKAIFIRDIDFSKDHTLIGYVLKVRTIDVPIIGRSVRLLVEDDYGYVEELVIFNLTEDKTKIEQIYFIGCELLIVNPIIRMVINGKPMIRVEDPQMLLINSKFIENICRFCGKNEAKYSCSNCSKAKYCSKQCQADDWKILKHKLICV